MNIQVLMSTMNRNSISELDLKNRNIKDDILIINQTDNFQNEKDPNINIMMRNMNEKGSSNSRNAALKYATGDICIFADDDIVYVKGYKEIINAEFKKDPDVDIITFQIICPDGTPFKSNYMKKTCNHNLRTILKCASIEIVFRRESVINNDLNLDIEFGLGSRYLIHDDVIFLADAVKKGLKVKYVPLPIVIHPKESSGTTYNDYLIKSKGAAFARIYGINSIFVCLAFTVKKRKDFSKEYNMLSFYKRIISGCFEYLKTHK